MKAFLFFLAFAVVMFSIIIYQQETASLLQSLVDLKNIADNAAESGALTANEKYNINSKTAEASALEYLKKLSNIQKIELSKFILETVPTASTSQYAITLVYKQDKYPQNISASSLYEWVKE